jgi:hypothetical protein
VNPTDYGTKVTVVTAIGSPTVVVPSPPPGTLRFVCPSGFPTRTADGASAQVCVSNESGGDVEIRFLFGAADLGSPGGGPIPDRASLPGAQSQGFTGGFLIRNGEDYKVELLSGAGIQVFASWWDIPASRFGLTRLVISDTAEYTLVPAPPGGQVNAPFHVGGGGEPSNLVVNPSGAPFDVIVDDGGRKRTFVSGATGNPFAPQPSGSTFYAAVGPNQSIKVRFQTTPSPAAVFAFAYRTLP